MPIYEYQCDACRHKFEILQKISDDLLTVCPDCNEEKLRKQVTAAAFHLKGTGWYETDFKDKKPKKGEDKGGDKTGGEDKGTSETTKPKTGKESKPSSADTAKTSTKTGKSKSSD
ncbi:MAG: zinc ribbon domain-containing protein [Gammaproteobacteria bacterium]|nr:zinc ribbon domain-containing protein [Gammaproteobacteria bacterium]